MTTMQLLWVLLFLPALVVELWAIARYRKATLSRSVWAGLASPWFRVPFFALWGWLTWHFIIEYLWLRGFRAEWVDDVLVPIAAGILGLFAVPPSEEPR